MARFRNTFAIKLDMSTNPPTPFPEDSPISIEYDIPRVNPDGSRMTREQIKASEPPRRIKSREIEGVGRVSVVDGEHYFLKCFIQRIV